MLLASYKAKFNTMNFRWSDSLDADQAATSYFSRR